MLRYGLGFWVGSSIIFSFCPAETPAQCRARVRVKRRYLRRRAVAFSSFFNFALPTPSSAQNRGAPRVPCSRVTWYRAMYGSVSFFIFCGLFLFYFVFFRLNTSPPSGAVGVATFHPGYLFVVSSSNPPPCRWPAGGFSHDFSLVLAPVFPFISTMARPAILFFLCLVCRRAFSPPPPRHTGGTLRRLLMGDFCLVVGSAFFQLIFFACSWLHSQTVRGVGVGFEEPHLRRMV